MHCQVRDARVPDRRGRKGSITDHFPEKGRREWALGIWRDRFELGSTYEGIGLVREAGKILELPEESVDKAINPPRK